MYVTPVKFAPMVGLPYHFILEMCQDGRLPCIKRGRKHLIPQEEALERLSALANEPKEAPPKHRPRRIVAPRMSGEDFQSALTEMLRG